VDPVPDPLLLGKSGSDGNRTRVLWTCSQELRPLDHRAGLDLKTAETICDITTNRINAKLSVILIERITLPLLTVGWCLTISFHTFV
jgi:hypothetical protein